GDEDFTLAHHVVRIELARGAGDAELEALVSELVGTALDPLHPLWQFHLVGNYKNGSAVILRIHHCYADGIALIQVLLSMTDADRAGRRAGPVPTSAANRGDAEDDALAQLFAPLAGILKVASTAGSTLIEKGKALGGSVDGVLLSSVAGALRGYLVHRGEDVGDMMIRALVPVNLRPREKAHRLGNKFGLVFLDLPIGIENPIARLYAVRANMKELKGSFQPVIALGILAAMGAGPQILQERLLAMLAKNATAVMTNVPGPQQPLYFAGGKIDRLMFWVPQSGKIGRASWRER